MIEIRRTGFSIVFCRVNIQLSPVIQETAGKNRGDKMAADVGKAVAGVLKGYRLSKGASVSGSGSTQELSLKNKKLVDGINAQLERPELPDSERLCPECGKKFKMLKAAEQQIEYCPFCSSFWMDAGELAALSGHYQDVPSKGLKLRSRESALLCPVCEKNMKEHIFTQGNNLLVDICDEHGLYLQGGEFERALLLTE